MINAGYDCTDEFFSIHSPNAIRLLDDYYIGDLDTDSIGDADEDETKLVDKNGNKLALDPRKKISLELTKKTIVSRDSFLLEFALPTPEHVLGLPTGKHVFVSATIDDETVIRRYTPVTSNHDVGRVEFLIKAYQPCADFPNGGKMSRYLDDLKVGDSLDVRGPVGEFEYLQNGQISVMGQTKQVKCLNMIAGGTGITPMVQIIAEILRNHEDETKVSLVYACREEGDLLMRKTIEEWAWRHSRRFRVRFVLSKKWPLFWFHSTGHINATILKNHLFDAPLDDSSTSSSVFNLMCGPPLMLQQCCRPHLIDLGHASQNIFAF